MNGKKRNLNAKEIQKREEYSVVGAMCPGMVIKSLGKTLADYTIVIRGS